jgi:hypothetical protein
VRGKAGVSQLTRLGNAFFVCPEHEVSDQTDNKPTVEKRLPGQQLTDEERAIAQKKFLASFSKNANVLLATKAAKVHRSTIYEWLEKDETFSILYNQAKEDAKDVIKAEVKRRGHDGWNEDVYQLGKFAGRVRKYSDTLLIFHAKMLMPEYRDQSKLDVNAQVTTHGAGSLILDLRNATSEELQQLKHLAMQMKARQG